MAETAMVSTDTFTDADGQRFVAGQPVSEETWTRYHAVRGALDHLMRQVATPPAEIEKLATFIMSTVPGEPSRSESAVDTAIRLLDGAYGPPAGERAHERA